MNMGMTEKTRYLDDVWIEGDQIMWMNRDGACQIIGFSKTSLSTDKGIYDIRLREGADSMLYLQIFSAFRKVAQQAGQQDAFYRTLNGN